MKKLTVTILFILGAYSVKSQSFYLSPEPLGIGKFHPDISISYNVSLSFGYELIIPSGIGEIPFYPEIFAMIQSSNRLEYGARIGMGIPLNEVIQIVPYIGAICIEDTAMGQYQLEMKRAYSEIFGIKAEAKLSNVLSLTMNGGGTYHTNFINVGMRIKLKKDDGQKYWTQ